MGDLPAAQHKIVDHECSYCRFVPADGLPTPSSGNRTPAGFEILATDRPTTFSPNTLSFGMMDTFLANPARRDSECLTIPNKAAMGSLTAWRKR